MMEKQLIKDLLYGSLREIASDSRYFYYSNFCHEYSVLSEEGKRAVLELNKIICHEILRSVAHENEEAAKKFVLEGLKDKT
jgi:hypothetical protein